MTRPSGTTPSGMMTPSDMMSTASARAAPVDAAALRRRHARAQARQQAWAGLWQDCYDYALPLRRPRDAMPAGSMAPPQRGGEKLFDATAADAADQLAASLLAQLAPPWSRWFAFQPGRDIPPERQGAAAALLDEAAQLLQAQFDRSNLAVELHQCFLDLVVAGTACLACEEAPLGEPSAFRFAAVPLADLALEEEGAGGRLDTVFRRQLHSPDRLEQLYPAVARQGWFAARRRRRGRDDGDAAADDRIAVIDCLWPSARPGGGWDYAALLDGTEAADDEAILARGRFDQAPFIAFRWLKAPGETYGRSPVMKALPDIKTANKVVELVLKNASIAVTGIWQADDDGVLNPANVKLVPGAIIPKAVGSSGLTPLAAPGRFDISQLVLDDLRARIRHALLADRLGQVDAPRMTATEVLERSGEMARLLGATFGRLQSELIFPLIRRAVAILQRRGEIAAFALDGREALLVCRSPLARAQAQGDVQGTLTWLQQIQALGPAAQQVVDVTAVARWLGRSLGVPGEFLIEAGETPAEGAPLQQMLQQAAAALTAEGAAAEGAAA